MVGISKVESQPDMNIFDTIGAKIWAMDGTGIVLDYNPMKALAMPGTKTSVQ